MATDEERALQTVSNRAVDCSSLSGRRYLTISNAHHASAATETGSVAARNDNE
jgi:hypothetical protein